MLKKFALWYALKGLKKERREYTKGQEIQGWLELSGNSFFIQKLIEWQEFNQESFRALFMLEADKRDIEKAKMLGRLDIIATILEKINQAKKSNPQYVKRPT